MEAFECPRCHFEACSKQSLIYHLKKKKTCKPVYTNMPPGDILQTLVRDDDEPKLHKCGICNKEFSHASSLSRHKKKRHQTQGTTYIENSTNTSANHSHNTSNSHNTTNTTNNNSHNTNTTINIQDVHIHPFGKEDISHVENDTAFLVNCIRNVLGEGIPHLVEKIYFNDAVPQNQNVKLNTSSYPVSMIVFAGDPPKWEQRDLHLTANQMVQKAFHIIVRYNFNHPEDAPEKQEFKEEQFNKIRKKQKGVYAPIKRGVILKAREYKQRTQNRPT